MKLRTMVKVETGQANRDQSARRLEKAARHCLDTTSYARIHGALGVQVRQAHRRPKHLARSWMALSIALTRCLLQGLSNDKELWIH